ncbi:hypothetical protein [Legionella donaldsonii]|uniref:hypothetical protein n=1 Tax=Legionella donaldsonii TaxID=45060 RepID=UPI00399C634A
MREKRSHFKSKPSHRSTYQTQHKFNQKQRLPVDKKRNKQSEPFVFSACGRDFNQLSLAQQLVFILALSALVSSVEATPKKQSGTNTETQKALVSQTQTFFSQPSNASTTGALSLYRPVTQPVPGLLLKPIDMSHTLTIQPVTGTIRDCKQKTNGVSAGKICVIKDKKYLLKVCEEGDGDRYSNILLGMHNLYFVRENIGIDTPRIKLVHEKNGRYISSSGDVMKAEKYLASEFIENFTGFKSIITQCTRSVIKLNHRKGSTPDQWQIKRAIREKVVEQIGEGGIAKLAVAGTFVQDLVMNEGNWGVANGKLVVIDADHSPQSVEEYLTEAMKMPGNINFDFSIQTLEHMASTYSQMLHKRPIHFHPKVDFTVENYEFLVSRFLTACTQAIDKIKAIHPHLPSDKPSKLVNGVLSNTLRAQFLDYTHAESISPPSPLLGP